MTAKGTESGEESEGPSDAAGKLRGVVAEGLMDFKYGGGRAGEGLQGFDGEGPVDCSVAGPEVLVFDAVIVVDMHGNNARSEGADGLGDADGDMGMAEVETDAYLIEMAHFKDGLEVPGGGGLADKVLDEKADAERAGKGAQML